MIKIGSEPRDTRVLVVEDEFLVGEMIVGVLEDAGYSVVGRATSGSQGVELTRSLRPDVVLMDIKMPDMDGIEATLRIQETCPTPVVVLTAHESMELVEQAGEVGVGAYLIKPPKPREVERAITIAMARFEALMKLRELNAELMEALEKVKKLSGMLPICASCKKIRDDEGYWHQVEAYIREHADVEFSHGICPDCSRKLYPYLYDDEGGGEDEEEEGW